MTFAVENTVRNKHAKGNVFEWYGDREETRLALKQENYTLYNIPYH